MYTRSRSRPIKSIESLESLSSLSDDNQYDNRLPERVCQTQRDNTVSLMKERLKMSGYSFPPQIITQQDNNLDENDSFSSLSSLSSSSNSSLPLSPPKMSSSSDDGKEHNQIRRRVRESIKIFQAQEGKAKKQEESEVDSLSISSPSSTSSVDPHETSHRHESILDSIENKPLSIGGFNVSNSSTMLFFDPFQKDQDNEDLSSLSDEESPRRKTNQEAVWEQLATCQEPRWPRIHTKVQNDKSLPEEEIVPISTLQFNDPLNHQPTDWLLGGNVRNKSLNTMDDESWYVGSEDLNGILDKYVRKDAKILHVGCGQSKLCAELVCRGYSHVCGLDNIKNIAHQLQREELYQNLQKYLHFYAEENFDSLRPQWRFQKEHFDCIFATNHLDFLASKDKVALSGVLGEITRCLKPGGIFLFVTCRHDKETEKINENDEISNIDDFVQTIQEFDCWWKWESTSNLLKRQFRPIKTYRIGVPIKLIDNLNGKVHHEKPFQVFVWRRKETIFQRKLRILAEHALEKERQAERDFYDQRIQEKLSKQREEQRVIDESAIMLQEDLLSALINQTIMYESEISQRQQIREQILLRLLEEERKEMVYEDERSAGMRTFEKEMRQYCRDVVISSIDKAVDIVEINTEIAQRANQYVMSCVAYCLEYIFTIAERQIEVANAGKLSEKGLIQFLKQAIEATNVPVTSVGDTNTTSTEEKLKHVCDLGKNAEAIKPEESLVPISNENKPTAISDEMIFFKGLIEEVMGKVEEKVDNKAATQVTSVYEVLNTAVKPVELAKSQKEPPVAKLVQEPIASSTVDLSEKLTNSTRKEAVAPVATTITAENLKESDKTTEQTQVEKVNQIETISIEIPKQPQTSQSDEKHKSKDKETLQISETSTVMNSSATASGNKQDESELIQEILKEMVEKMVQLN